MKCSNICVRNYLKNTKNIKKNHDYASNSGAKFPCRNIYIFFICCRFDDVLIEQINFTTFHSLGKKILYDHTIEIFIQSSNAEVGHENQCRNILRGEKMTIKVTFV